MTVRSGSSCCRFVPARSRKSDHVGSSVTVPVDRDVLLEFLASRERRGKGWVHAAALAQHAISPALVEAARAGTLHRFDARLADTTWRFETAPGLLTAIALDDEASLAGEPVSAVTLTGPSLGADTVYSILSGWRGSNEEDCEHALEGSTTAYARGLAFRLALRAACRESATLRAACADAFRHEMLEIRLDWFGMAIV